MSFQDINDFKLGLMNLPDSSQEEKKTYKSRDKTDLIGLNIFWGLFISRCLRDIAHLLPHTRYIFSLKTNPFSFSINKYESV